MSDYGVEVGPLLIALRYELRFLVDEPADKWRVIDTILDFGQQDNDTAALAHYVLWKLPIQPNRDMLTWAEVDSCLSEMESK